MRWSNKVGGSLDSRIRFAVEVATAVADEIGHTDYPTHTA
jgi:2,4-dienoyl-CoA reductase-like NADH-dependent reductase (Old Yellow Enzyme family)